MTPPPPAVANELLRRYVAQRDPAVLGELFVMTARELLCAARRVTGDRTLAEDALHDAFLAVFQGHARFDVQRPALPWLCGVVTRKARQAVRRRTLLARREGTAHDADLVEATPTATSLAAEDRDRLLRAIAGLPRAYRLVIERRFLRGDLAPVIARDLALAKVSVRSRLQRGLRLLRDSLRSLLVVLLALFSGRRSVAATGLAVAGSLAALLVLLIWWTGRARNDSLFVAGQAPNREVVATAPAEQPPNVDAPLPRLVGGDDEPTAPRESFVRLQFADGSPAAHVGLRWTQPGGDFALGVRRAHTDDAGRVALHADAALPLEVRTDRGPVVVLSREAETAIVVPVAGRARNVVVRDVDGQPVPHAAIWLGDAAGAFDGAIIGASDAEGRVTLRALADGSHLAAYAVDGRSTLLHCIRGGDDITLQVGTSGRRVLGCVVDIDGKPVHGARVGIPGGNALQPILPGNLAMAGTARLVVETAVDGTFAVPMPTTTESLLVEANGFVPALVEVAKTNERITVTLAASPRLVGRVTGEHGTPLPGAAVRVCGARWFARRGAFTDDHGDYVFEALPPGPTEIEICLPGHTASLRSLVLPPAGETRFDAVLTRRSVMRLRVQDGEGVGVAGIEAGAGTADRRPSWITRSDARGELAVELPGGRVDALLARRGRHSPWVTLATSDLVDGTVDAARLGSARLLVEVVDSAGRPVPLLGISCRDALGESLLPVTRRGDRWATGLLPPGDCELRLLPGAPQVSATTVRVAGLTANEHRDLGIVPLPTPVVQRIAVVGNGLAAEDLLFVVRDLHDAVLATAVGTSSAELTAPRGDQRLAVFGARTEWRMGIPIAFGHDAVTRTVMLRPGRRRVLVVDEALDGGGDATITIDRIDAGTPQCVLLDHRREAEAATRRLEPVLGEGTFALTIRDDATGNERLHAVFVVGADSECVEVHSRDPRVGDAGGMR